MTEYCDTCGQLLPTSGKALTPRELDALSAWWHTGSVKGASDMLGVSERTVTNQLYSARGRYGFHKTTELVQIHFGQLRTRDDLIRSHNQRKGGSMTANPILTDGRFMLVDRLVKEHPVGCHRTSNGWVIATGCHREHWAQLTVPA